MSQIDRAVVDLLAQLLALGPQAVEVRLPLRKGLLGFDQCLGVFGVAHDAQEPVDRRLQRRDAGIEVHAGGGHVFGSDLDRLGGPQPLEVVDGLVELGDRHPQHHRDMGPA